MPKQFLPKNCVPTKKHYLVKCIKEDDKKQAAMDTYFETGGEPSQ